MDVTRISAILVDCLGNKNADGSLEDGTELIDAWAVIILWTEKVHEYEDEMVELLRDWPNTSWGQPVPPLGQEINYLQAGAILGDQGMAFMLFAFGKLLDWWQILEPCSVLGLAKDDPLAQQMAGSGMVAISGYKPTKYLV